MCSNILIFLILCRFQLDVFADQICDARALWSNEDYANFWARFPYRCVPKQRVRRTGLHIEPPSQFRVRWFPKIRRTRVDRTCGAVCVDEDALGRASRLDPGKAARRNAALEHTI